MLEADVHPSLLCNPGMGFHGLKDVMRTTAYLRQYCEFLTPHVEVTAQVTRAAAEPFLRSKRGLSYLNLHRPDEVDLERLTDPEDKYERAMFKKWSKNDGPPDSGWHRLIQYQVPVSDRRPSSLGLKAIDLLAVSPTGFPVTVELKSLSPGTQAETPLRAILEAAAYTCILQADWPAFREELIDRLKGLGIQDSLPDDLKEWPLVIAAPPEYWTFWNNPERKSFLEAKPTFRSLVHTFRDQGFPISFVSVEGSVEDYQHLSARKVNFLDD